MKKFSWLVVLFFVVGCMGPTTSSSGASYDFTLKNLDGQEVSLNSLLKENKAVLLNFWATWCPYCREEIPNLIKLQKDYAGKKFSVVGMDVGESASRVSTYAKKMGINYPKIGRASCRERVYVLV